MASRALKIDPAKSEQITSELLDESVQPAVFDDVGEVEIAVLAYQYWEERGCPIGSDQEDWFRAEETLKNRRGSLWTAATEHDNNLNYSHTGPPTAFNAD